MARLFFVFMVSLIPAGTALADGVSTCSTDTVPIQILGQREPGNVTTLYEARLPDYPIGFPYFVTTVTEHVAAKLAQEKLCLDSDESRERSLLQFVLMPVSITEAYPIVSEPSLKAQPAGVCRISSPWLDLAIERKPVPQVRGFIRYNERQLLADQAVLAGAVNVPPGVALPMKGSEFDRFAFEYAHSEIPISKPRPQPIEERVPPDLLWLFRRAWQSTIMPFTHESDAAMERAMNVGAGNYTAIVIALTDQCFASDGAEIHYDSILDLADLIDLEQYKIVTLTY